MTAIAFLGNRQGVGRLVDQPLSRPQSHVLMASRRTLVNHQNRRDLNYFITWVYFPGAGFD